MFILFSYILLVMLLALGVFLIVRGVISNNKFTKGDIVSGLAVLAITPPCWFFFIHPSLIKKYEYHQSVVTYEAHLIKNDVPRRHMNNVLWAKIKTEVLKSPHENSERIKIAKRGEYYFLDYIPKRPNGSSPVFKSHKGFYEINLRGGRIGYINGNNCKISMSGIYPTLVRMVDFLIYSEQKEINEKVPDTINAYIMMMPLCIILFSLIVDYFFLHLQNEWRCVLVNWAVTTSVYFAGILISILALCLLAAPNLHPTNSIEIGIGSILLGGGSFFYFAHTPTKFILKKKFLIQFNIVGRDSFNGPFLWGLLKVSAFLIPIILSIPISDSAILGGADILIMAFGLDGIISHIILYGIGFSLALVELISSFFNSE